MSEALIAGLLGLALLDSLNPATIGAVALILVAAPRRPGLLAGAAVIGAAFTVFLVGAALFLTAGSAAAAVDGIVVALRFVAFGAAATILVRAGIRRLRDRERSPITLPPWFTPATALPFGAVLTAADLPNAFPYFIALERLVGAGTPIPVGIAAIAAYSLVYCIPCLVLLVIGLVSRRRTRAWLERLVARFGSGIVRRSVATAILLWCGAVALAAVPFVLLTV